MKSSVDGLFDCPPSTMQSAPSSVKVSFMPSPDATTTEANFFLSFSGFGFPTIVSWCWRVMFSILTVRNSP